VAAIDIFHSLFSNDDVVEFLRPRLKWKSFLSNRQSSAWEFTVGSDSYMHGEIGNAYQTYLRQMIVLAATYTELILKDFFNSFFTTKPTDLIELLALNCSFRKRIVSEVSFEKIMVGEAKETMMKHAFNTMQRADSWRIVKHLAKQAHITLDHNKLFDALKTLISQRDEIVHNSVYNPFDGKDIETQKIYDCFKLILSLLFVLEKIADKNNIPFWKDFDFNSDEFIG
jgi:hypothetical protein